MEGPRIGSLFSGYGGLTLATQAVVGGTVAWHSEIEAAPSRVLEARFPGVPNLGDVTHVDWSTVEPVDVIEGGSPCQDLSAAGRRAGMKPGTRSGLWSSMCDAVDIIRPRLVIWENVRGALSAPAASDLEPCPWCVGGSGDGEPSMRALGRVVSDLADIGYVGGWVGLRAADVGAPHGRFRIFVVARPSDSDSSGLGADIGDLRQGQPDTLRGLAADSDSLGPVRTGGARGWRSRPSDDDLPASDAEHWREPERARPEGREGGERPAVWGQPRSGGAYDHDGLTGVIQWGQFGPAITRWESVLGRVAPSPTEPGSKGQPRLSQRFVEWMMGLPDGWVTDVPGVSSNDHLKMLGNGVVPQQAAAAIRFLLSVDVRGAA